MSKLTELWIKATDEREIEEYSKEVRDLYDYTIQLETNIDKAIELLRKNIDFLENDSISRYEVCEETVEHQKKALEILERGKEQ